VRIALHAATPRIQFFSGVDGTAFSCGYGLESQVQFGKIDRTEPWFGLTLVTDLKREFPCDEWFVSFV
jgi:hypothetical protein